MNEAIQKVLTRKSSIQLIPWSDQYADQAFEIAKAMHARSIYHFLPLDPAKVARQLAACGNLAKDRYFKMAVRDGVVLGGFYGHYTRVFFCDALLAYDLGWWVKEGHRGTMATIMLLADFEKWAQTNGAQMVVIGQVTGQNIERTTKLYQHCGYRVVGFNAAKEI